MSIWLLYFSRRLHRMPAFHFYSAIPVYCAPRRPVSTCTVSIVRFNAPFHALHAKRLVDASPPPLPGNEKMPPRKLWPCQVYKTLPPRFRFYDKRSISPLLFVAAFLHKTSAHDSTARNHNDSFPKWSGQARGEGGRVSVRLQLYQTVPPPTFCATTDLGTEGCRHIRGNLCCHSIILVMMVRIGDATRNGDRYLEVTQSLLDLLRFWQPVVF